MPNALTRRLLLELGMAAGLGPSSLAISRETPGLSPGLRTRIRRTLRARRVPGAAVALVRDGVTLGAEGFGLASIPFAAPVGPASLFHLGSVSKQFTAAAVLSLADQGRIRLEDVVGRHVRDLPPSLAERPISALLSHTSGVPDYEGLPGFDPDRRIERPAFIRAVGAMPSDFAPGEAWAYSNSAYVLLGYLIADLTGLSYHETVNARLLRPAGLTQARFDDAPAIIRGRVEPYVLEGGDLRHAVQMDGDYSGWPDGGLLMSAHDAARWETGLQARRVIPASDLRLMTTPVRLSTGRSAGYGFAWFTDRVHGQDIHYHSGSVPGFLSVYMRFPAARVGAVVMVNLESPLAATALREIAQALVEAAAPGVTALSLAPLRDDQPGLTRQAAAMITRGKAPLDEALFAPEMSRLLARAGVAPPNRSGLGPPRSFQLVEAFDEPGGHVRRYRAVFADRTEHYAFGYAADGRVFRVRAF